MSKRKTRDEDADEASDVIFTAELSAKRIAKVYKFKGMVLVDIREMWTDAAGDPKPSKKGISLTLDQFKKLLDSGPSLLHAMEEGTAPPATLTAGSASSKGGSKAARKDESADESADDAAV